MKKILIGLVLVGGLAIAGAGATGSSSEQGATPQETPTVYDLTEMTQTAIDAKNCNELQLFWDKAKGHATQEFISYLVTSTTEKHCDFKP